MRQFIKVHALIGDGLLTLIPVDTIQGVQEDVGGGAKIVFGTSAKDAVSLPVSESVEKIETLLENDRP